MQNGACPSPAAQSNFNLPAYMGTFYEYAKYLSALKGNAKCVAVVHTQKSENVMYAVDTLVDPTSAFDIIFSIMLCSAVPTKAAIMALMPRKFRVTCEPDRHNTRTWIFTRERVPSPPATVAKAENVVSSSGFDLSPLIVTDQSNC